MADAEKERSILEETFSRRDFLDYVIGGCVIVAGSAVAGGVAAYMWPSGGADQAEVAALKVGNAEDFEIDSAKTVNYNNKPVIVIRTRVGFAAFLAVCTHAGCITKWDDKKKVIFCPCHAGFFDTQGKVVSGPPDRPLEQLKVREVSGEIFIEKG